MSVNKICIAVCVLFLFSGCSEKKLEVHTIEEPRLELNLKEPNQLKLNNINFIVITEQNSSTVFKQLETSAKDKVIIGITDEDYIKMSENMLLIKQYIIQQKEIIRAYKDYYENKK